MNYRVVFSKRRTIALMVTTEGQVTVRAPKRTSLRFIEQFVGKKQQWLKWALGQQQKYSRPAKQFLEGEKFLYLGKEHVLQIINKNLVFEPVENLNLDAGQIKFSIKSNANLSLVLANNTFQIAEYRLSQAKQIFEHWYKQQAQKILSERAQFYSRQMNVKFNHLTIRNTVSRWGSCSSLGNINFSYRLVMAPLEIIDYVVIHELAHLIHQNHSPKFWELVEKYYPKHKLARKWLKQQGYSLKI